MSYFILAYINNRGFTFRGINLARVDSKDGTTLLRVSRLWRLNMHSLREHSYGHMRRCSSDAL